MEKNKDQINKKLWGGRFAESTSSITEMISSSIEFDSRLYRQDIRGSIAHAQMLNRIGVLSELEYNQISEGLNDIQKEIDEGIFKFDKSLEDIHMNIESKLIERIGDAGRKLHTARSRNDQIALDLRLYIRDESSEISGLLKELIRELAHLAEQHVDVIMPGYTHMQIAQTVRFSHHMLAHAWALLRDLERLENAVNGCNVLPLGSGALAGVNYKNDREFLKDELDFDAIIHNSMDAVSDRDFVLDFLYFCSVLGMHLSRFCEEIVLWSGSEFAFIRLSDRVTTGSSIMPQKRNPDIAELIRGKSGRLYGNLISLLTTMKGLPLTYNRDLQEDKEPLFDSVDTVKLALMGMHEMVSTMEINKDKMREAVYGNFSTATDLADYLVKKNVPFRKSHEIVGSVVRFAEKNNISFFEITVEKLKEFSPVFEEDAREILNPETSTERKESAGGTSKKEIIKQIKIINRILKEK
ncbi:MAG: argininosuccinate lyase [Spirochaetes bacterium]|jgi:argininosuccinate lyase|nr:argininosuccinate lyase [Spirochaetota bacterium]